MQTKKKCKYWLFLVKRHNQWLKIDLSHSNLSDRTFFQFNSFNTCNALYIISWDMLSVIRNWTCFRFQKKNKIVNLFHFHAIKWCSLTFFLAYCPNNKLAFCFTLWVQIAQVEYLTLELLLWTICFGLKWKGEKSDILLNLMRNFSWKNVLEDYT